MFGRVARSYLSRLSFIAIGVVALFLGLPPSEAQATGPEVLFEMVVRGSVRAGAAAPVVEIVHLTPYMAPAARAYFESTTAAQ